MGVPLERYEDYLSIEEYEQWLLRQKLLRSIEKKNISKAEQYLESYRIYEKQNAVEAQYFQAMKLLILQMKNAPLEEQQTVIERAVKFTIPNIDKGLSEKMLLSEQELNLLIEYVKLRVYNSMPKEESTWRCNQYKDILNYIEHSHLDCYCRAKVYSKAVYFLCELILDTVKNTESLELGIDVCNQAIELLRESSRLYYFVELVDILEKLIKEYEILLNRNGQSEKIKVIQAALEEKADWRNKIVELYAEYNVTPFMENFCYIYREMESYCIGDVIRTRRKMFGMTKEQLCQGICSVKTLTRLETKKVKTQMSIVRQLFERLGLCAEYIRTRVITNDYKVLQLAEKFVWYENNEVMEDWIWCLKELEQKLCMEIPQNKQFIMHSHYLLGLRLKELSKEEYIEKLKEALEYTIPLEYVMKPGKKFLSCEEYTYIRGIGMRIDAAEDNPYMEIIKEICEQNEAGNGLKVSISTYEFLMTAVISYLGNIGEYDKSDELSNNLIKESLIYRRQKNLAEFLYNNIWNYQQRLSEGKKVIKEYKEEKELRRCLLLSKYNKMEKYIKFFEQTLEDYEKYN